MDHNIVGTILCGHDGRSGYIYPVAVDPDFRGRSIGTRLIDNSLNGLAMEGITKCHIMVAAENEK